MRDLFIARKQRHFTQLLKYWRLVFNDHFIIALFFLFGALAYRYAQWLPTVAPTAWWVWPLVLAWLTLVTQAGQLATLVQPADPVVLLPQTSAAQGYFRAAFYYSAWRGILLSEAGLVVSLPLLLRVKDLSASALPWYVAGLVGAAAVLKWGWLKSAYQQLSFQRRGVAWWQWGLPLVGWSLSLAWPLVGLGFGLGCLLFKKPAQALDWRHAVALEQQRMDRLYRFFNLFTDVPAVQGKIRRRKWLQGGVRWLQGGPSAWDYLYAQGLVRNVEVGNLVWRLTAVAMVVTYFVTVPWLNTLLVLLFIYLVASQVIPFYHQYDQIVFPHLFPLPAATQPAAFRRLMNRLLSVVAALIVVASWSVGRTSFLWWHAGGNVLLAGIEVWLLNRYYLKVRIKKK
ncbi:ABC transporter permease [Limosilactobacillus ingluviei]|uniref:ABC transporter permease n=1 Tax=Limosilactobacillus ingluviei TaxID=148604 RepID=UPI0026603D5A|nr:ABC transporter permease [Limosilactobacillus ingluviei]